MQRKELNKRIRKFSKQANFYKLGLIRKYIKQQEKEEQELINAVPKVICPYCGSKRISVEYDDREYSCDSWLHCKDCDESFDDTFGFIDAIESLSYLPWGDRILIELSFEEPDIKSLEWQEFCEEKIKRYLGLIK